MSSRYRATHRSSWRRSAGNPYRVRYDNYAFDSPIGFTLFVVAVVVGIGTIAMAIIGVVALSGGFTPTYVEPRYPKPEGYRFDGA